MKADPVKTKKRVRRPRRELPEDLTDLFIAEGDRPNDLDVIAGRGGGSNHHEGNKRYWRRILMERPVYKQLGKHDNTAKNEISEGIYMYILSTGGRFLQLDPKSQKWFHIPKKISLDKIKQALRDRYIPHFLKGEPELQPAMAVSLSVPSAPTAGTLNKGQSMTQPISATRAEVEKVKSRPQNVAAESKRKISLLLAAGALCLAAQPGVCDAYQPNHGFAVPKQRSKTLTETWMIQKLDETESSAQDETLSDRQKGLSVLLTVPMAWGTFEPAIRLVYKIQPDIPSFALSLAYYIIATIPLCLLAWSETGKDESETEMQTESGPPSDLLATLGGLELGTYLFFGNALQVIGLKTVPSDRAAFLLQLTTIFVPLVQCLLARNLNLLPAKTWAACCVALAGVALIGTENAEGGATILSLDSLQFSAGDQCIMLGALVYTFHCIRLEKYAKEVPSAIRLAAAKASTETGWSALAVGVGLAAAAQSGTLENPLLGGLQASGRGIIDYTETTLNSASDFDASQYLTLAGALSWIGLVTIAYTITAQSYGQSRVSPSTANLIYTLQPIFTALLAYLLLGETLSYTGLVGGALIGSAVLLVVAEDRS